MSIAIAIITENGIVMASESRKIEYMANDRDNFKIVNDSTPKTFVLANRVCLNYTGISTVEAMNWSLDNEISNLQMMTEQGASIVDLVHHFKDRLDGVLSALPETIVKYGFLMATYYNNSILVGYESFNGGPIVALGAAALEGFKGGLWYCGEIDIIKKLLNGEEINYVDMTIDQAIEFVNTALTVGFTYLKYFKGYRQVSNGPINLAVVTPGYCGFLQPTKDYLIEQLTAAIQENEALKRKIALLEGATNWQPAPSAGA